jgi:hypothetical protein
MRYTPIGQETSPLLLQSQGPTRDPADTHYAAEDSRGQN